MNNKLTSLSLRLNQFSEVLGKGLSWLVLLLTLIVFYDVSMRFLFRYGSVALQELEWHLFSLIFLLGAAYTYKHDGHVRVEILSQRFSEKARTLINLCGDLFVLLPLCLIIINSALPFVSNAYIYNEGSPDPGGLPFRYLIKAAIPVGFMLLALQAVANSIKAIISLRKSL